jgi:cation diffusion facilitator CzcD-associated flavoprotein CzcO
MVARARIVIIGAGFGGIGLGIKLRQAGIADFVILEKSQSVGGVWAANGYPGAACDVPSHLYSFSFAPKADWPDKYARQADILAYLKECVRKHGLDAHIRLGAEVTEARWDDTAAHWTVRTRDGATYETQAIVTAVGQLCRPVRPHLPGIENFNGTVFHSAEWRHDYDVSGKRVAVIGTGASAIQFIPEIAPRAASVTVFQRSAPYVLPKKDRHYPAWQLALFRNVPGARAVARAWEYVAHEVTAFAFVTWPAALRVKLPAFRNHLVAGVQDRDKQRALTPHYRIGCKRFLLSNEFYPAMGRANVSVVTDTIREVAKDAILTADGIAHNADCIIFGTGFTATDFLVPMRVTGANGLDLHDVWRAGAQAHLGITVAGFPNFFMLYGPNTNLAHTSIVYMLEAQIRYVIACLERLATARSIEVKRGAQAHSNESLVRRMKHTVWSEGCTSWYQTAEGRNTNNWPGYTFEFAWRTRAPRWDDYVVR